MESMLKFSLKSGSFGRSCPWIVLMAISGISNASDNHVPFSSYYGKWSVHTDNTSRPIILGIALEKDIDINAGLWFYYQLSSDSSWRTLARVGEDVGKTLNGRTFTIKTTIDPIATTTYRLSFKGRTLSVCSYITDLFKKSTPCIPAKVVELRP